LDLVARDAKNHVVQALCSNRTITHLGIFEGNGYDRTIEDLKSGELFPAKLLLANVLVRNQNMKFVDNVLHWPVCGVAANCSLMHDPDSVGFVSEEPSLKKRKNNNKKEAMSEHNALKRIKKLLERNRRLRRAVVDCAVTLTLIKRLPRHQSGLIGILSHDVMRIIISCLFDTIGHAEWLQCDRSAETRELTREYALRERENYLIEDRVQ